MKPVNIEAFIAAYADIYAPNNGLTDSQHTGLTAVLQALMDDSKMADIRWCAYVMATIKHECAGTWQPIAEYGKGAGHPYGEPDPTTGQTYYGRGYCQITWKDNYRQMGKVLGVDLVNNPDRAMEPAIAWGILSYGMRNGSFTGVGLPRYISDGGCDYTNARKIINSLDQASKIAAYAVTIEGLLNNALQTA